MTELHMGLIGLGAVAVVGVVAYNKWQERKHRQVAEQMLRSNHEDVLLDPESAAESSLEEEEEYAVLIKRPAPEAVAERHEPSLDPLPAPEVRLEPSFNLDDEPLPAASALAENLPPPWEETFEPEPAPVEVPAARAPVPPPTSAPISGPIAAPLVTPELRYEAPAAKGELQPPPLPQSLLSPAVDYIVSLETVDYIPAAQFLQSQHENLRRLSKRVIWVGFNEATGEWDVLSDDSPVEYRRLRIGAQMADRQGAISDAELSIFHTAMRQLAEEFMAVADLPTRKSAMEEAWALDRFCADVDIQIGINVVATSQAFAGTKIRALAEAAGMTLGSDGVFVRRDDDGRVLYSLLNQGSTPFSTEAMKTVSCHGLTFLLDVPRVPNGDRVVNQMAELARRFAEALHGAVVDDNRHPLTETQLEPIRRQVAQYQGAMAGRGLVAGGPLSLRLFA